MPFSKLKDSMDLRYVQNMKSAVASTFDAMSPTVITATASIDATYC